MLYGYWNANHVVLFYFISLPILLNGAKGYKHKYIHKIIDIDIFLN